MCNLKIYFHRLYFVANYALRQLGVGALRKIRVVVYKKSLHNIMILILT